VKVLSRNLPAKEAQFSIASQQCVDENFAKIDRCLEINCKKLNMPSNAHNITFPI
jgi:hypothetical protein